MTSSMCEAAQHPVYNKNDHPNLTKAVRMVIESAGTTDEKVDAMLTLINMTIINLRVTEFTQ